MKILCKSELLKYKTHLQKLETLYHSDQLIIILNFVKEFINNSFLKYLPVDTSIDCEKNKVILIFSEDDTNYISVVFKLYNNKLKINIAHYKNKRVINMSTNSIHDAILYINKLEN